jgi:hypothetical protein
MSIGTFKKFGEDMTNSIGERNLMKSAIVVNVELYFVKDEGLNLIKFSEIRKWYAFP